MKTGSILTFDPSFADYLRDESRRSGHAQGIAFPLCEEDVRALAGECSAQQIPITIQGARTGITAGAVPYGGTICNLSKMNRITGLRFDKLSSKFILSVMPGVRLSDLIGQINRTAFDVTQWSAASLLVLDQFKQAGSLFFPPDPTETTATLGGMVACNASGARSYRYGPTAHHIYGLRVCLADGEMLVLNRGENFANERTFLLTTESGRKIEGVLPSYDIPSGKCVAGYRSADTIDLIDVFIGMEGTLGIITSIDIGLLPLPKHIMALVAFMPSESAAIDLVKLLKNQETKPVSIEFFNKAALDFLRNQKKSNVAFDAIPAIDSTFHTAVYFEFHGNSEDDVMNQIEFASQSMLACGGSDDLSWGATTHAELLQLKYFRHSIPEAVNLTIDQRRQTHPDIVKLGTDMAVPDDRLRDVMELYNSGIIKENLEAVIFGHIGNNHLHVNILPATEEELGKGKKLYLEWAKTIVGWGGTVSAEHGIGKSKAAFLEIMYGSEHINEMRSLKKQFDPQGILNRDTLFTYMK